MIKIELKLPDFAKKFKQMENEILGVLAATMQTNRAMMFDKDGADNGKKAWAPLVFRDGRPLQKSGTLRKSMGPSNDGKRPVKGPDGIVRFTGKKVTIGSSLLYARLMNDGTKKMPGGVLRAKNAKALKIPTGGGKFIFRKSVKIPGRKMNEITNEDKAEFSETLANYIAEALNG